MAVLRDVDVMVLDALRDRPHPTHMCVAEALDALASIRARRSYLTHISHDLDHAALSARLPETVFASYDGLRVEV